MRGKLGAVFHLKYILFLCVHNIFFSAVKLSPQLPISKRGDNAKDRAFLLTPVLQQKNPLTARSQILIITLQYTGFIYALEYQFESRIHFSEVLEVF